MSEEANGDAEIEATLTDDEEEAEASDSEFGISDRQLEGFWQQLSGGAIEVALDVEDADDMLPTRADRAYTGEQLHAEYGLSDAQIRKFGRLCSAAEDPLRREKAVNAVTDPLRSKDPLGYFLNQRRASNESTPVVSSGNIFQDRPAKVDSQDLPRQLRPRAVSARRQRAASTKNKQPFKKVSMISNRLVGTTMWYLFRIYDRGEERFYMKRYSEFKSLHAELEAGRSRRRQPLPELPESGIFGIRNILDIGDFNAKRRKGLERFVEALFPDGSSVGDDPALEAFFGRSAPGRIRRNSEMLDTQLV